MICSSSYAYTNLIILRANFGCKTLQRLVVEQPIQSDYFFMKFISVVRKDIILIAPWERFLMVTTLHIPAWFLILRHSSSPQIPHNLLFCLHTVRIPVVTFLSLWKKEKEKKKRKWFWLDISMTVCLQRPLQFQLKLWLAAGNSHKEEPSSVLRNTFPPWSDSNAATYFRWCSELRQQEW